MVSKKLVANFVKTGAGVWGRILQEGLTKMNNEITPSQSGAKKTDLLT